MILTKTTNFSHMETNYLHEALFSIEHISFENTVDKIHQAQ